ncbi:AarF/ABC1/UbiB kinase family protein [Clostridium sp. C8-1-8]|uniref:ABC1 kinase family protein n=1 Tax=Clostridium sp. C8-1-8 TaxID=2698831 RepID=UPI00136E6383|nr:AarF/ABC1/UbiB kinase family protein [Clostridium sp. C8-1-8]
MRKETLKRFREIVKVFAYYGFGYLINTTMKPSANKSPENLRKAFVELGPTFIKIGQILSTRTDLLPEEYTKELAKLQDDVPWEAFSVIAKVFQEEFNMNIDDVFLYLESVPLASASVAQVHKGVMKDGREVVIKIQRPNIREKMELDISILKRIVKLTKTRFNGMLMDPVEALQEIMDATSKELDFERERDNISRFKILNKSVKCIAVPYVVEEFTSTRVLTMENIQGFKINDIYNIVKEGYDRTDIAKKLALSYCKQIFDDGFFHGDPHPGNLLIRDGKICFIDFGLMGELSESIKESLNDAMMAIALKDIDKVMDFLMEVGVKKGRVDRTVLYDDIDYLLSNYLSTSLKNIRISTLLREVFDIAERNNIQLPTELIILVRGMVILEGVIAEIAPDMNILDVAIPFVKSKNKYFILNKLRSDELALKTYTILRDSIKIPSKIVELSDSVIQGRARVNLQIPDLEKTVDHLNKMINRVVFGLIVAGMIIGSSIITGSNVGPKVRDISVIGITGYFASGIFALWLLISIIRSGNLK